MSYSDVPIWEKYTLTIDCLLYTSDAADELEV